MEKTTSFDGGTFYMCHRCGLKSQTDYPVNLSPTTSITDLETWVDNRPKEDV